MQKKGLEIPADLQHLADAAARDGFGQAVH
jgi:hypothetical protein